ncbi:hypothetical protein SOVF_106890, partial [Spinacia oleracea]
RETSDCPGYEFKDDALNHACEWTWTDLQMSHEVSPIKVLAKEKVGKGKPFVPRRSVRINQPVGTFSNAPIVPPPSTTRNTEPSSTFSNAPNVPMCTANKASMVLQKIPRTTAVRKGLMIPRVTPSLVINLSQPSQPTVEPIIELVISLSQAIIEPKILKEGKRGDDWCIISDRQKGIDVALNELWPQGKKKATLCASQPTPSNSTRAGKGNNKAYASQLTPNISTQAGNRKRNNQESASQPISTSVSKRKKKTDA